MSTELIPWDEKYNVGINTIDTQHKKLVSLINKLAELVNSDPNNRDAITNVIKELKDYTVYHFKEEEIMMDKCSYPDLKEHKVKHVDFIEKVLGYENRFENGEDVAKSLLNMLKTWLVIHISVVDRQYTKSMKAHGIN